MVQHFPKLPDADIAQQAAKLRARCNRLTPEQQLQAQWDRVHPPPKPPTCLGCDSEGIDPPGVHHAKGLCMRHYQRQRRATGKR